jgi:hypothetical protein
MNAHARAVRKTMRSPCAATQTGVEWGELSGRTVAR